MGRNGSGRSLEPLTFGIRQVVVWERTKIRLHPHLGEFDQAALFKRRLDYERPVLAWLERHAAQRYDVGIYTVFLDALIKSRPEERLRHVYAFEPSREAYGRLCANLRVNAARFVTPFAVAISDGTGLAAFYEPEGHLTNGSLSQGFAGQFSSTVEARLIICLAAPALEQLLAGHPRVLVKIDAEGLEPRILGAMAALLERHAPDLLIEVLPAVDEELRRTAGLAGYAKLRLTPNGATPCEAISADPADRDWLLTRFPEGIIGA